MDSSIEVVEERLKSFLVQLKAEYGILNRITYKNKNQHRRCAYFQYLLKVRRDLNLLQSTQLEEILSSSINVITGAKPRQKVQFLESLKRRCDDGSKPNFLERLMGIARLLSEMVETILKAATEISILLARSYFMSFSLTVTALLARIRVLVQQILLDVVIVFNIVSTLSQKKQSIKIIEKGCEVFREYYPINNEAISLECLWEKDKFVLHEKVKVESSRAEEENMGDNYLAAKMSEIQYHSIEAFDGDDENNHDSSSASIGKHEDKSVTSNLVIDSSASSPPPDPKLQKLEHGHKSKVAFLSIKKPPSSKNVMDFKLQMTESKPDEEDDPYFTLLTGGSSRTSLF